MEIDARRASICRAQTVPSKDADAWVVMVHGGPGGDKDGPDGLFIQIASRLVEHNIASLRFDMLGAGASAGDYADMTLADQAEQIECMIQVVREKGCRKLGVLGESLGAASLLLKWPHQVDAAALLWPAIDLMDTSLKSYLEPHHQRLLESQGYFLDGDVRVGRAFVEEFVRLGSLESRLEAIKSPTLLVHGDRDTEVPVQQSERAFERLGGHRSLLVVPRGEHGLRLPYEQRLLVEEVGLWFWWHLRDPHI